jgi:hypothetical protein
LESKRECKLNGTAAGCPLVQSAVGLFGMQFNCSCSYQYLNCATLTGFVGCSYTLIFTARCTPDITVIYCDMATLLQAAWFPARP